jgi:hypothetical protein
VTDLQVDAAEPKVADHGAARVAYLLGAGATHGSIKSQGSGVSLVMPGLIGALCERMRERYLEDFVNEPGVGRLVNEVVDTSTDFEQLITFLEDTPSDVYRRFAQALKKVFSTVLRSQLDKAQAELGPNHSALYAVLLDMYLVDSFDESLAGFLTLNYDAFLEHAVVERLGQSVDYGVDVHGRPQAPADVNPVRILKLHGSFGWKNAWPIEMAAPHDPGLWIPPGIRKAKTDYPFNAIWGAARELLDCDVLRIIGCNLGPNDWDLVSLLFTTMHARDAAEPYRIEVISWPSDGLRMAGDFPYLNVQSLLELPDVGPVLVSELLGTDPLEYESLDDDNQKLALEKSKDIGNPFEHWLRLKAELMFRELPSIGTPTEILSDFVAS